MPDIARSIPAATNTTAQPLIGWQYEVCPYNVADVYVAVAKAAATDLVTVNLFTGSSLIANGDSAPVAASIIWPDQFLWQDRIGRGEKIGLEIVQGATSTSAVLFHVKLVRRG